MPVSFALVEGGLRDIVVTHELLAALVLQPGIDFGRLGCGKISLLLVDRRLVGRLLDPEQQVVLFDILSFGEGSLLDETRYPRDNIDLVDCSDASDVTACFRDLPADHGSDRYRRRRRGALRGGDRALGEQAQAGEERPRYKRTIRIEHRDAPKR